MVDRYSESELKLLAILPSITAPLSFLGASMIIFMIVNRKMSSDRRLYHRLLLAIAATDLLTSSVTMLGPLPVRDNVGAYMAKGNVTTCSASGFVNHFFGANVLYNLGLMWTFLCQIRYELREEVIAKKYERQIHVVAIGYPLMTGILGLVLQVFNPVNSMGLLKCYIAAYPPDCDLKDSPVKCTRGEMALPYLVVVTLIPTFLVVGSLFIATFLVWWTVRQHAIQARRTSQFNVQRNMSREVAIQSIIYGIFFFNNYVWVLIDPVVDVMIHGGGHSHMRVIVRVISEIFYPSQGLWTWLIFIRPRYLRIRTTCKEQSFTWVLRETVFGERLDHSKYMNTPRSATMRIKSQPQGQGQKSKKIRSGASGGGDGGDDAVSTLLESSGDGNQSPPSNIKMDTTISGESLVLLERTTTTSSSVRWDSSLLTTKDEEQEEQAQEQQQHPLQINDNNTDTTAEPPPISISLDMTGAVLRSSN
jgi:hypothetical protein